MCFLFMAEIYDFEGKHFMFDFKEAQRNTDVLSNPWKVEKLIENIAKQINATLLQVHVHPFGTDTGVSAIWIVEESHISIHTWPEYKAAMIDIFTCWEKADPFKARDFLLKFFAPKVVEKLISLWRGDSD